jgi:aryl-alcohol dehydrogenase-like predicted oxidoreductase
MGLSSAYGTITSDEDSLKLLNDALDIGCNFIDTSNIYGQDSSNEKLLSKLLAKRRDEVFLCTKFGIVISEKGIGVNCKPEYIRECLEKSLKNLGVDTIDLYYSHRIDPNTPIEETMSELAKMVKEGKIRHIGLSECSAETLRRAVKVHPVSAIQIEVSPWALEFETNGVLEVCREHNIAIVAYSPLGRGFLTGRYTSPDDFEEGDFRKICPRFQGENFKKNYELVEKINELAKKKGVTPGQLTLAWVLSLGEEFIPIPGTKSIKYLHENLAAASVELSDEEKKAIREIINSIDIQGTRYPEMMEQSLYV